MAEDKKATIEELFEEIDKTITELEKDDLPLDRAFSLYEKGIKLTAECEKEIDTVEKKVQVLSGGELSEFS
ncbi:MAG: exodeoxyribonuclease VII small subunit [Lachnospiraceae bacterium]|nr:exodeoxyribonuclease VII small subunit [Lachnospiraceae bacterium]MCR5722360.1 exodeoxyribonuclease VII small subunit [Lachnospiraceae bacterium]